MKLDITAVYGTAISGSSPERGTMNVHDKRCVNGYIEVGTWQRAWIVCPDCKGSSPSVGTKENTMSYILELEQTATEAARRIDVSQQAWSKFLDKMTMLRNHNPFMYAHSLRVGLYCLGVATQERQRDLHLPLFGGCGHDIGKCKISNDLLNCTTKLTEQDFEAIHHHPMEGYELLKDDFIFAALIAGLHHKFGPKQYGIELDQCCPSWFTQDHKDSVIKTTMLVMICDFFDAVTTRRNSGSLIEDPRDINAVAQVLQQYFADYPDRCSWLVSNLLKEGNYGQDSQDHPSGV